MGVRRPPAAPAKLASGRGKSLNANVLEIMGTAEVRDSGLDLSDLECLDDKGQAVEAPFGRLFLPLGKIDYYVILD